MRRIAGFILVMMLLVTCSSCWHEREDHGGDHGGYGEHDRGGGGEHGGH